MADPRERIVGATRRGLRLTLISQAVVVGSYLLSVPVLGRLLTPDDFGMIASIAVVLGMGGLLVDGGFLHAVIQAPQINERQLSNLFWFSVAVALFLQFAIILFAADLASLFSASQIQRFAIVGSIALPITALGLMSDALLRRELQFGRVAAVSAVAAVGSTSVTIGVALATRSAISLAIQPVAAACIRSAVLWYLCPWRPGLPTRRAGSLPLIRFGLNVASFNILNYIARNADKVLIGWRAGSNDLGHYERAYRVLTAPLSQINAPLSNVMIPSLSRLVDDPEGYRRSYTATTEMLLLVCVPLAGFVMIARRSVVLVLLGPVWGDAAPILAWLSLAMIVQPLCNTLGWLLISQGRTVALRRWGAVSSVATVMSFVAGLPWGARGVAASYAIVFCLVLAPALLKVVTSTGPVGLQEIGSVSVPAFLVAFATTAAVGVVIRVTSSLSPAAQLLCGASTALTVWGLCASRTQAGRRLGRGLGLRLA